MRRQIRILTLACLILFTTATAAFAGPPTDAIKQTVDSVMAIIKSPAMNDKNKRNALLDDMERKVMSIFDFRAFSASTVGPKWRSFSEDQRQRFITAFTSLLRASYIEKVSGYNGEQVKYLGEVMSTKGDKAIVRTSIRMSDGKDVPVDYSLHQKDGGWKVYNVRVETVGLVENYHGQFKDILLKGSPEDLIKKVHEAAAHVRKENEAGAK